MSVSRTGRTIKKPTYLDEYVLKAELECGSDVCEEENVHSLAVFEHSGDPITFTEAVKYERWRRAMGSEIDSIGKHLGSN